MEPPTMRTTVAASKSPSIILQLKTLIIARRHQTLLPQTLLFILLTTSQTTTTTSFQHAQHVTTQSSPLLSSTILAAAHLEPQCQLGNESYQLGERWNPNLPPFGVQVCVQCECVVRQRKSCYEAKVTCRRITNECPIIDSCPDGKKPVTTPGQCCKSCQTPMAGSMLIAPSPSSIDSTPQDPSVKGFQWATVASSQEPQPASGAGVMQQQQQLYRNDRIKEYQSIIRNLQPCPRRDADRPSQPVVPALKPLKGAGKNDLNGIDSRMAFKSLDPQSTSQVIVSVVQHGRKGGGEPTDKSSSTPPTSITDDTMRQDQQHPNDVQSSVTPTNYGDSSNRQQQHTGPLGLPASKRPVQTAAASPSQSSTCSLGGELFQVGENWNPVLPPFGVQVCVQCSCTVKQIGRQKACYEARVTCRRLNKDCPAFKDDLCPDGQRPVSLPGQCCKSCPSDQLQDPTTTITNSSSPPTNPTPERARELLNEQLLREYHSIMKTIPSCAKLRDGSANSTGSNANVTTVVRRRR